jgi:hypothetical protein
MQEDRRDTALIGFSTLDRGVSAAAAIARHLDQGTAGRERGSDGFAVRAGNSAGPARRFASSVGRSRCGVAGRSAWVYIA